MGREIVDTQAEIAVLDSVKALGYTIPTYEAKKLAKIIDNDLSLNEEERATIISEIEDGLKQV